MNSGPSDSGAHPLRWTSDQGALLPGQTAAFANYTSYRRGLNGLRADIAGLPAPTA